MFDKKEIMNIIKGMVIGPICGAFIGTILMLLLDPAGQQMRSLETVGYYFFYVIVGSLVGWVVVLMIGIPLLLLYRKMGWNSFWQYLLGGIACVFPFWCLWFYPFNTGHWDAYKWSNSIIFFSDATVAAIIFWWIAIKPQKNSYHAN